MPTRRKNGRSVTTSPTAGRAHGRLVSVAPVVRTRIDPGDPAERLGFALVERHLHNRGIPIEATPRAIKARIDRARDELAKTPTGAEEARRITLGLTANGGALLRTVERSHVDLRPFAARAAVRFVALVREHAVVSTAALLLLASAAQWSALAEALRDLAFERGPSILSTSKSMRVDDGGTVSAQVGGFADMLKLAQSASGAARLDLLTALDLEQRARAERDAAPLLAPAEVQARMADVLAERARRAALPPEEDEDEGPDSRPAMDPPSDPPARGLLGAHGEPERPLGPDMEAGAQATVRGTTSPTTRFSAALSPVGQWARDEHGRVVVNPRPTAPPRPGLPEIIGPGGMPANLPSYMTPPARGPRR